MQQTEKYGFNLIEMSDTFSTEPLNENARKMDEALAGKGNCVIRVGEYVGDAMAGREIEVGFKPRFLVIHGYGICIATENYAMRFRTSNVDSDSVTFTDTGFRVSSSSYTNRSGTTFRYIAFA